MSEKEPVSEYPFGFIFCAPEANYVPEGYSASHLFPGLHFDPQWHFTETQQNGASVAISGSCVRTDRSQPMASSARDLALALASGQSALFDELANYAGRYVVFYRENGATYPRVVGDATCLRSVCFTSRQRVVSSHTGLANRNRSEPTTNRRVPMKWGCPGRATPWDDIWLLTPNMMLDTETMKVSRFFPVREIAKLSVNHAAEIVASRGSLALGNFMDTEPRVILGLSAGVDSRTALALAKRANLNPPCLTFIMGSNSSTLVDAGVSAEIAQVLSLDHEVVDFRGAEPNVPGFRRVAYYVGGSLSLVAETLRRGRPWRAFISANLVEIGRAYYAKLRVAPLIDSGMASDLYLKTIDATHARAVDTYGREAFDQYVRSAFADFYDATDLVAASKFVDINDLFYWEHRMPAWASQSLLVRDLAMDTFIPFNSRSIFEALLSVDFKYRKSGAVVKKVIRDNLPELSHIPVNPSEWPMEPKSDSLRQRETLS